MGASGQQTCFSARLCCGRNSTAAQLGRELVNPEVEVKFESALVLLAALLDLYCARRPAARDKWAMSP
jgi:hypothetical protein